MIVDNMRLIHDEDTMDKLGLSSNKMFMNLQNDLLDMNKAAKGTIFDII